MRREASMVATSNGPTDAGVGALGGTPTRGALSVEVSTSEPVVTAASEFSIFVIIRNPYNVPITVHSVQTHIPMELVDTIWERRLLQGVVERRRNDLLRVSPLFRRLGVHTSYWWGDLLRTLRPPTGPRIAEAVSTDVEALAGPGRQSGTSITIGNEAEMHGVILVPEAAGASDVTIGGKFHEDAAIVVGNAPNIERAIAARIGALKDLRELAARVQGLDGVEETDREVFNKLLETSALQHQPPDVGFDPRSPLTLQPGDAVVKQFVLRARRWLLFTPIAYTFQIQIRYLVDGTQHFATVPFSLDIRAALNSTLIGSALGGIVGAWVQALSRKDAADPATILVAAVFSAMAVVAFARKASAQQIVSVEDFWGGLFIGFLVGYLGEGFFRKLIGQAT
jgi:ABC-type Fe3+-siderophore transport system permease subunit